MRLGAVLALREAGSEEAVRFLADPDPQVATEAARALYDLQLPRGMASLAATLPGLRADLRIEPYLRRALHAALRTGGAAEAEAVAAFAADSTVAPGWRDQALQVLAQWDRPDPRDGVLSRWAPLPDRAPGAAKAALAAHLPAILACAHGEDFGDAVELARREHVAIANGVLAAWAADPALDEHARVYALRWLDARKAPEEDAALGAALGSRSDSLFDAAFALESARDPGRAVDAAVRAYGAPGSPLALRQAALRALGRNGGSDAVAFLAARLAEARRRTLDSALVLDAIEAAHGSSSPALRAASRTAAAVPPGTRDSLAPLWPLLHGGDAGRGQAVFESHPAAQCVRCHTIDGTGGTTGPDLSMIGTHDRRDLLESIVAPNARIAPGFETTTLTLTDGTTVTGTVKAEDARHVELKVDDQVRSIPRARIRSRPRGGSVMPPMLGLLEPAEIRDVIEWLASRRDAEPDVPLASLVPREAATGTGAVGHGVNAYGAPLSLGHRAWPDGLGVHAPARLVYDVPAGARAFVARVGLDDGAPGGLVGFAVRIDGRTVWKSPPLKFGQLAHAYAAVPAGATQVELLVDDGGNGIANDAADWVGAGFVR